jgi:hypothetical protein
MKVTSITVKLFGEKVTVYRVWARQPYCGRRIGKSDLKFEPGGNIGF